MNEERLAAAIEELALAQKQQTTAITELTVKVKRLTNALHPALEGEEGARYLKGITKEVITKDGKRYKEI